jgi:hypothetical protein
MKRFLIVAGIAIIGLIAFAKQSAAEQCSANYTDWACMNDCLELGYTWGFCKQRCEY